MIYLDNAATSYPKPESVYRTLVKFGKTLGANPGRALYKMAREAGDSYENARRTVAEFFGVKDSSRIIFTMNATDGVNIALKGVLRKGDHIVSSTIEHTCVLRPLNSLKKERGIEITRIDPDEDGRFNPKKIESALRKNTRLVAITQASNVAGILQPIDEIAPMLRKHGALLLTDSAQTAGVVSIDIEKTGIDIMATTGHKSLFGPPGTGVLYVREGIEISPWREGGTGDSAEEQPEKFPERLEGGTLNTWGVIALAEGIKFINETGVENIRKKEKNFADEIFKNFESDDRFFFYGPRKVARIGILTLNIKGVSPAVVGSILDERYDICVRTGLHCAPGAHAFYNQPEGGVRISPGWFNSEADIETLIRALKEIADEVAR